MRFKSNRNRKSNKKRWIIAGILVIGILGLGTSYGAWADAHTIVNQVNTKVLDFVFSSEYEDDFSISMDYTDKSEKLDAIISNSGKRINISGVEAVDMDKLLSGEASIRIEYRLEASDHQKGLLSIADKTYDLGTIPFELSVDEPYWKICNQYGSWGVGEPSIGIPSAVVDLLPESLGELHGYNRVVSNNNGIVRGTITIQQLNPDKVEKPEIDLTSLNLSDEINLQIADNELESSDLEVMANYNFSIPLAIDQSSSKYYE